MFEVGKTYTKNDIYGILNVPLERQRGAWDKGLRKYEDHFFIFANVGVSARTGHDYDNFWDGDLFHWQAANFSNIIQPQVRELLQEKLPILLFTRQSDRDPFTYEGKANIHSYEDTTPVRIVWKFIDENEPRNERLPEEILAGELKEGNSKTITVNKYERNPEARRQCLAHYGLSCQVCGFNFEDTFGPLGKDFIHVHHTKLLSSIRREYIINPIEDLVPVCPNCHAMLHKVNPPLTIMELKAILKK